MTIRQCCEVKRENVFPRPHTLLGGLLLVFLVLTLIGWVGDRAVDALVDERRLSILTGDELHLACGFPGFGIVVLGPVWLYRWFGSRRRGKP
jgi:hypothetical protein